MKVKCSHTELVDIDLLTPNPRNPNKHPDNQITLLAKIMGYQGWRSPIVVSNRSGFITKGHGRLMAAKANGWTQVPVDRQEYANEADEWADMVADNKIAELSETDLKMVNDMALELPEDFDLELLGIPDFDAIETEELDPQCDEDEVPEYIEPKAKLGDIYQLGRHRLMCGDSTSIDAVERLMDGTKAEICVTDPPYGIAYQSNHRRDKFDVLQNDDVILKDWVGCAHAATNTWIIFFIGWQRMAEWLEVGSQLGNLTNILVWRKSAAMGDLEGSFSPTYEMALAYNRGGKLVGGRPSAVIEQNIDQAESFKHPTQKPIGLCEKIMANLPPGPVLDLFGGSGWTLITCEKVGRQSFSMELDPKYVDVIVARWEKYTGKTAELLNG